MLMPRSSRLVTFVALFAFASADFGIRDGKLAVLSSAGTTTGSVQFAGSEGSKTSLPTLQVEPLDTLRLTFSLSDSLDSVPAQTMVLAKGLDTGRTWTGLVKVRAAGKGRWELDMTRAPASLLSLSQTGRLQVDLLVADFDDANRPVRLPLAELSLSSELVLPHPYWDTKDGKPPTHLEWEKYALEPELRWTFREAEKPVNSIISLTFSIIALTPWLFLIGAWSRIAQDGRSTGFSLFTSPSPSTLLFILLLISQEALILIYWTSLRLYQYLPLALGLGVPTVLTGRSALTRLREKRIQRPVGGKAAGPTGKVGNVNAGAGPATAGKASAPATPAAAKGKGKGKVE